ncbi:ATPase with role in protein import into the ER [Ceratobasidium sp. 395]|nr:ATPase with role in protein import into the ER [Ceratobasidium sp. 395]
MRPFVPNSLPPAFGIGATYEWTTSSLVEDAAVQARSVVSRALGTLPRPKLIQRHTPYRRPENVARSRSATPSASDTTLTLDTCPHSSIENPSETPRWSGPSWGTVSFCHRPDNQQIINNWLYSEDGPNSQDLLVRKLGDIHFSPGNAAQGFRVGQSAKHAFHVAPAQTIYSTKRLIGRTYDDPILLNEIKFLPFEVVNQGGRPTIEIDNNGILEHFSLEEISAMILSKMKQTAEAYLGSKITRAVVTVPAYFNDAQRQATKDAGTIAGLDIVRMVSEPTAAALAYVVGKLDKMKNKTSRIIVYDLGGGTLDVSLLSFNGKTFNVTATAGDAHLGGEDFNARVVDYFTASYKKSTSFDVTTNSRSMSKLRKEVERAKHILSHQTSASLEIEAFHRGLDFSEILTRTKFEQLNKDLFEKALQPVRRVLADARISVFDVDEVVLVGGSTRIPKVQSLLTAMFKGKELSKSINPDEAVAIGAAIQAGILSHEPGLEDLGLTDISSFTIGIETAGGAFEPFIRRNTQLPASHSERLSTVEDNQRTVLIQVFEGEHTRTSDNNLIGQFELSGIPPAARGIPQVDVVFKLDVDGILRVEAKELLTGNSNHIVIKNRRGRLSEQELSRMTATAGRYETEDANQLASTEKINEIQRYLEEFSLKLQTTECAAAMARKGRNATVLATEMRHAMIWMEEKGKTVSLEELEERFTVWKSYSL